ncbi:MAG: hypothetical protein GY715_00345 [Planctomycetes bacterium]|nr:hypothetical protein [Planctomycetota bacterium]
MRRIHLLACTFVAALASAAAAQDLSMDWFTCDGGGSTSTGGTLEISGSIGQHDSGEIAGGTYVMTGGFWVGMEPVCREDLNDNGDVDFADILAVIAAWGPCPPSCPEDLNDNGSVDFADILAVIGAWGPCP